MPVVVSPQGTARTPVTAHDNRVTVTRTAYHVARQKWLACPCERHALDADAAAITRFLAEVTA